MSASTAQRPTISNEEQLWLMQQVKLNVMTVDEAVSWTENRESELRSMDQDLTPQHKHDKKAITNVKHQFRAARKFKNMLNSKKQTKKLQLPEAPKRKFSSVGEGNDVLSSFAHDLKNKQVYNFSIHKCVKHKAPVKRILQVDFDGKLFTLIHHGNIVKTSPFSSLVNVDGQDGKKLFIYFDDSQELEINAENLAEKTKLIRLLNVVIEQNEYEERGQTYNPIAKLQLSFTVIKEGYLEKKGSLTASHWIKRLVVIRAGELAYYRVDEEEPSAALNIIHLSPGSIEINPDESNSFSIATSKETHRFRLPDGTAILQCSQELIRDEWIQAIQDGCNKHYQKEETNDSAAANADFNEETKATNESYNILFQELEKLKHDVLSFQKQDHSVISEKFNSFLSVLQNHKMSTTNQTQTGNSMSDQPKHIQPSEIAEKRELLEENLYDTVEGGGLHNEKKSFAEESTSFISPNSNQSNLSPVLQIHKNEVNGSVRDTAYASAEDLSIPEENVYELDDGDDINLKSPMPLRNGDIACITTNNDTKDVFLYDLPPPPPSILNESVEGDIGPRNLSSSLPPPPPSTLLEQQLSPVGNVPPAKTPPATNTTVPTPPAPPLPPGVPAPPPPPPVGVPPPPPSGNGTVSKMQGKVQMRPFHWVTVPKQLIAKSMWDNAEVFCDVIAMDELEEMFKASNDKKQGTATNDAMLKGTSLPGDITPKKKTFETYLDQKTAQNLGIFLAGFKLRGEELIKKMSIVREEDGGISTEHIVGLRKYAPEPELKTLYAKHAGREAEELTKQDRFLAEIARIPRLGVRLESLQIVRELPLEIENLEPEIDRALNASQELLNSKLLESFLCYVLAIANQINSTNSKGTANGIRLSSLVKTGVMKTNDRKSTLLQVVLKKAKETHPHLLNLPEELASVSKSQSYSTKGLLAEIDIMRKGAFKAKKNCEVLRRKKNQPTKEDITFCGDIEKGLSAAETGLVKMTEKCVEIKKTLVKLLVKFGESPDVDSQELFGWVRDFMEDFKKNLP